MYLYISGPLESLIVIVYRLFMKIECPSCTKGIDYVASSTTIDQQVR